MSKFAKILSFFVMVIALSSSALMAFGFQKDFSQNSELTADNNLYSDDRLIGTWRIKFKGTECDGYVEFILDEDGNYSSLTACDDDSSPLKVVGTWTLVRAGEVRLEITDWSPKADMGGPTRMNSVQTFRYTFINDNRMRVDKGRIANRVQ